MSKIPDGVDRDQITVVARRVLLDGLEALETHRDAITVIGAQAVYLRTVEAAIRSAGFTSDGDLSIDPQRLPKEPHLNKALEDAGFAVMDHQPGLWQKRQQIGDIEVPVELDLLIGKSLAPTGKRSAQIPPHGQMSARWVEGIELACVDRSPMVVAGLDPADDRRITVNVAGVCALLVAKSFKIHDRATRADKYPERLVNKDAGDVIRIMMATQALEVAAAFDALQTDERVGEVAVRGRRLLEELFGGRGTKGVTMAVEALRGDVAEGRVTALAPAFIRALT
ncbi:MAG TPA: hypothetical protein VHX38_40200 [Pseudonocardiaceae bacterium]|nr:hypothetical protein [Pseudonocardiaceae bacterium]